MNFIHIRNLEKFHPGYKDRDLKWAKIYFAIVQGDPEFEIIDNETDKWRFVAMILLELQAKKPIPDNRRYWAKKGFDLKKRPMSLTLKMLQGFVDVVTEDSELCNLYKEDKYKEDKEDKEVGRGLLRITGDDLFNAEWVKYPNRQGRKNAFRHFRSTVKSETDLNNFRLALENYLQSGNVKNGFIKNGSTWFNEWQDWISPSPEMMKGNSNGTNQRGGGKGYGGVRKNYEFDPSKYPTFQKPKTQ